jgi:hypothetical protein
MRAKHTLAILLFPIAAFLLAQETANLPLTGVGSAVGKIIWQYDTSG